MKTDERIKWWGEQEKPSEYEFKYLIEHEMSTRNYWQISNSIDINTTHYRRTQDSEWLELPKVEV